MSTSEPSTPDPADQRAAAPTPTGPRDPVEAADPAPAQADDEPLVDGGRGADRDADEPQPDDIDEAVARAEASDPPFRTPAPGQQGQAG